MDPLQVGLGILIGMVSVIAILGVVVAIRWFSDRGQRSAKDEAIEAAHSLAIRQLEEYVRGTKESSSRPG
jgi:type II secretory pathway pseudopilin PulG